MCNRYRLKATPEQLADGFDVASPVPYQPKLEFFPGKPVPVVRADSDGRRLDEMVWGFERPWSKRPLNNARVEKAWDGKTWGPAMKAGRRCLLPAAGFIEWHHTRLGHKDDKAVPHLISLLNADLFTLAGLWEQRGDDLYATMLISEPNEMVREIHNKKPAMPVILDGKKAFGKWLDQDADRDSLNALMLSPYPAELMSVEPLQDR